MKKKTLQSKRVMGRPPIKSSLRRSRVIRVRLKESEFKRLQAEARRAGVSLSEYIRLKLEG